MICERACLKVKTGSINFIGEVPGIASGESDAKPWQQGKQIDSRSKKKVVVIVDAGSAFKKSA